MALLKGRNPYWLPQPWLGHGTAPQPSRRTVLAVANAAEGSCRRQYGQVGCSEDGIQIWADNESDGCNRKWTASCLGRTCQAGLAGCEYDAQCKDNRVCENGRCVTPESCDEQRQRGKNCVCQNGRCVTPGSAQNQALTASGTAGELEKIASDQARCDDGNVESCIALAKMYEEGLPAS